MFKFLGTLLLIWLIWWLVKIARGVLKVTRPLRQARKAYRQAEREAEKQRPAREAENRSRAARTAMRSYAEDVEYTEIIDTPTGKQKISIREYTECQVSDAEWEEIK